MRIGGEDGALAGCGKSGKVIGEMAREFDERAMEAHRALGSGESQRPLRRCGETIGTTASPTEA
jgi:hypothetical protein